MTENQILIQQQMRRRLEGRATCVRQRVKARRHYLKTRYAMTLEDYENMLLKQSGKVRHLWYHKAGREKCSFLH